MEIAALSQLGLVDAVTGGNEWGAAVERGTELEKRTGPVQTAVSATFTLAVVRTWIDEFAQARELFGSLRATAEARAEESALPWILAQLVLGGVPRRADGRRPAGTAQEGIELALQADQEPQRLYALGVRALVRAGRGDVEGARADAEATLVAPKSAA